MKLELLKPAKGSVRNNVRLGRGQGSGGGGTAKRGHKGAKSRSGYSAKRGFEGGQMPLQRRVPKFGFKNINRIEYKAINLDAIQALIDSTNTKAIDLGFLYNHGLISKSDKVKVLGRGELKSAVEVKVHAFSKSAVEAIEKAGGKTVVDTKIDTEAVAVVPLEKPKKVAKVVEVAPVVKVAPVVEIAPVVETPVVEVAPVAEAAKVVTEKVAKASTGADDLKKIEGIGPKIAELLIEDGITTFAALSITPIERLEGILSAAGSRFATHNPTTWPQQAELAAAGNWAELKELQDRLNGGRPE